MAISYRLTKSLAFTIIAIALFLSGCSSSPTRWYLNGQTQADLDNAYRYCTERVNNEYAQTNSSINQAAYDSGQSGDPNLMGASLLLALLGESAKDAEHEKCVTSFGFTKAE